MSNSLTQLALSGITASQVGLNTTGQNIANAQTPGFSRQSVIQSAAEPTFSGSGYIGTGVNIEGIRRSYSVLLAAHANSASSEASRAASYADGLNQINNIIGNADRSASVALSSFFSAVQQVTTSPADAASRQSMLASAQTLAQRFRDLDGSLIEQRNQVNDRVAVTLENINSLARQIGSLNSRIAGETAGGRMPNDLLDQREVALNSLSKLIRTNATTQPDGTVSVYLGSGVALVSGGMIQPLALATNQIDLTAPAVGTKSGSGAVPLPDSGDLGGEIGGLIALRDDALTAAEAGLGRLARVIAETVNARHRLGQDLQGNAGGDFFSVAEPVAAASAANQGNGSVRVIVDDASQLAATDYRVSATADGYSVTRLGDGTQELFTTQPFSIDGLHIELNGAPVTGDSFMINAARGAAGSLQVVLRNSAAIAAGSAVSVSAATQNLGDAVASITVNAADGNLRQPATIVFSSQAELTVTSGSASTTMPYTPGMAISANGWSVTLQGTPKAGDVFTVAPAVGATGDNRNLLALAALAGRDLVGGASYTGAYGQLVADFSVRGRESEAARKASASFATAAINARDEVGGVNLEEEAMNLLRYQQSYQAAGKLLSIANTLFETIISIYR
jgi:flagellar hook-associated protein 1 FlgK